LIAVARSRFLMRWRAQSALISPRHAPDLLGVALEEDLEEPAPEAVRDPLLEGALLAVGEQLGPQPARSDAQRLQRTEAEQRVHRLERVVEEAAAVIDPREPRADQELLAKDLLPELADVGDLGEEAVPADVEAVVAIAGRAREAPDHRVALEDEGGHALLRELVGRAEPCGARADHDTAGHGTSEKRAAPGRPHRACEFRRRHPK
jgi:hypothetical protein